MMTPLGMARNIPENTNTEISSPACPAPASPMLSVSTGTMGATLFRHMAPAVMDMSIMNSTSPGEIFLRSVMVFTPFAAFLPPPCAPRARPARNRRWTVAALIPPVLLPAYARASL